MAHQNREQKTVLKRLKKRLPSSFGPASVVGEVLREGKSRLLAGVADPLEYAEVRNTEVRELLLRLDPQSLICVPLSTHHLTFGAITFVLSGTSRKYGDADLAVAEDFAHRASIALENVRLYEEAKEADRRKDEFLATLAHELRNPLAPVRNALEIVRTAGVDAKVAGKAISVLERQVDHMVRLVDDLLDLSRLMRGKIQLRPERVFLGDIVTRAIETARPLIDAHKHQLVVSVPETPIELYADPVRLDQIISNLLNNAAKYTERGGVIRLIAKTRGQELAIKIRDTGIGIDPKLLPHLFDLFRQAESSLDRSEGGLGIGLTLVRSLVKMHGGRVEARSDGLGTGAEFIVRLPIHKKQASAPEIICTDPERISNPQYRILVVDDNVDAAEMLSTLLQLDGHQVWTAHDGKAALETAQSSPPRRDPLGYRPARNQRPRSGPSSAVARGLSPHDRHRHDRVRAGARSPAITRGRLRRPFDQTRRPAGPADVPARPQRAGVAPRLEGSNGGASDCFLKNPSVQHARPELFLYSKPDFSGFSAAQKKGFDHRKIGSVRHPPLTLAVEWNMGVSFAVACEKAASLPG